MADDYVLSRSAIDRLTLDRPTEDDRTEDSWAGDRSAEGRSEAPSRLIKPLKVFIALAVLCLGGELIWLLGVSPFMPFSKIDVTVLDEISREEILFKAGISDSSSYFSVNAKAIEKALSQISPIESARVFKYFPGRLRIILEGRRAVASSLASLNGQTVPVLFDSQGVIFKVGGTTLSPVLPVVSGLVIEDPAPGMRLPGVVIPFLQELEKIEFSSPELLSAVSEFRIDRKPYDGFDLILYPTYRKIKVRLSELNEDLLRYALLMVDVLSSREGEIDILDFRFGIASYIPKEAYSE